jgi:hypothetical protein
MLKFKIIEKIVSTTDFDDKEVVFIHEGMFDAMMHGEAVCINGLWISIPENSELKFIDLIEQKIVKEWGLDGTQEEK